MKRSIYVYSGTGNSLWTAKLLAEEMASAEVVSMAHLPEGQINTTSTHIGLVFPVHIWGLPRRVLEFVRRLNPPPNAFIFAVAVNAGQVANTLNQMSGELLARGAKLGAGYSIVLPSNYIPWGRPGSSEEINRRCLAARERLSAIARHIAGSELGPVEQC